uniref:DUF4283 domain-containing protein n=1 Tax=Cannabis sativa TaxID=3483 RepID=A0A803Q1I5_CANSA
MADDSVQVTTKDLTCDLNLGEVDRNEEPSRILLGKLYCYSRLGRKAIFGSLNNAWSSLTGWSWKEREDGLLQFTFQMSFDVENVLNKRPWLVCGFLLVLMPWPSWLTPAEVSFDQMPIWVRLKSIPPLYWNKTNLQELAGNVSAVYEPLFLSLFLQRKGIKDFWIQYQYKKLPKICFKCGPLSHDLKYCFKTLTVIKDEKGVFLPMFGSWMDEDAVEKSLFHLPIPKWFNDWISQQQALKDPTARNQLKMQRRWREAEATEWRELRRQMPGKRRHVELVMENRVESGEMVLNCFPAVYLPRTGEITPFENSAEGVVEKVIPVRPLEKMATAHDTPSNTATETTGTEKVRPEDGSVSLSHSEEANNMGAVPSSLTQSKRGSLPGNSNDNLCTPNAPENEPILGDTCKLAVIDKENFTLNYNFKVGLFFNSLLGPQTQPLEWTSGACWARAFGPLTGTITVDKFQRGPTLFNPILDIEDFKCQETEHGPKKRKSNSKEPLAVRDDYPAYSPGSNEGHPPKRKRGRPRKYFESLETPASSPTNRNKSKKLKGWTGVNSKSLKKKSEKTSSKGKGNLYRNLWNTNGIDLAIHLKNNFVIIEKNKEGQSSCIIEEIVQSETQSHLEGGNKANDEEQNSVQDFQFGAMETFPEKSPQSP